MKKVDGLNCKVKLVLAERLSLVPLETFPSFKVTTFTKLSFSTAQTTMLCEWVKDK